MATTVFRNDDDDRGIFEVIGTSRIITIHPLPHFHYIEISRDRAADMPPQPQLSIDHAGIVDFRDSDDVQDTASTVLYQLLDNPETQNERVLAILKSRAAKFTHAMESIYYLIEVAQKTPLLWDSFTLPNLRDIMPLDRTNCKRRLFNSVFSLAIVRLVLLTVAIELILWGVKPSLSQELTRLVEIMRELRQLVIDDRIDLQVVDPLMTSENELIF
jgi:hypothetical protein